MFRRIRSGKNMKVEILTAFCNLNDGDDELGFGEDCEVEVEVGCKVTTFPADPSVGIMETHIEKEFLGMEIYLVTPFEQKQIDPKDLDKSCVDKINNFCLKNKESLIEQVF